MLESMCLGSTTFRDALHNYHLTFPQHSSFDVSYVICLITMLLICYYMGTQWGLTKAWTSTSSEQEVRGYFKTISAVGKPFEYGLLTQTGPK